MTLRFSDQKQDALEQLQLRFLQIALGVVFLVYSLLIIGDLITDELNLVRIITLAGTALLLWISREARFVPLIMLVLVVGLTASVLLTSSLSVFVNRIIIVMITTALFMSTRIYMTAFLLMNIKGLSLMVDGLNGGQQLADDPSGVILVTLVVTGVSIILRVFRNQLNRSAVDAKRAFDLIEASAEVGQVMSRELDLNRLLSRAVNLIRDRFAFYHVQVFLVDDAGEYANLVASTGEVGEKLLARKHRLAVGSQSVIGRVTRTGVTVIADDTTVDMVHARNELLPNTRSELALPLLDGQNIIGALDVQSTQSRAFTSVDSQALEVMANQLTNAIRNARLFEQQQVNAKENQRLLLEAEANLREIQRLNRQLTKEAWDDYLQRENTLAGLTLSNSGFQTDFEWSAEMVEATEKRRSIVREGAKDIVAVPIMLRNEVLGVIEIEASSEMNTDEVVHVMESMVQRLGVNLDNARLFEEAQDSAAQEQHINEIGLRYQTAGTVDDLLKITLTELQQILQAEQGSIRLGSIRPPSGSNGGAKS